MRRSIVQLVVGLSVIIVHMFAFAVIMFFKSDWTSSSQRLDLALTFVPITATYFVAVVKSAVDNQDRYPAERIVNINYVSIVFIVTGGFLATLLVIIFAMPGPLIHSVEDARQWITITDIGLGSSFGYIASDLFGKIELPPTQHAMQAR